MRILIVGAGALGGLVGAFLARAGEAVTMLEANAARAHLLNTDGLQIVQTGREESIAVPMHVVTSAEGLEPFDLVFIAVKAYQTEGAVRAALPAAHSGTMFLSMQNGIGNTEVIAGLVGADHVLCGITYHSVQHVGPGRLQFRPGIKPIQIAPLDGIVTPEIEAIGATFRNAELDTAVVANIDHVVWQKLLHNAAINPVSAITGLTCREILGDEDLLAFIRELCAEIVAVMRARGIPIVDEEDPFRPLLGSLNALGNNRPTMWQDLARGVRTEVDALNGAVVAEAKRLGLLAPHNAALVWFVHSRERQRFLNRQRITHTLGLDAKAGTNTTGGAIAGVASAASRRADRGNLPPVVPLESTRRLKEIVHAYYRDLEAASDDPSRFVAACSSLAPVEIVRALGIAPYFPENHAALISARHEAARYMARASEEGFSQFSSSAMRADIGALLAHSSPLVAAHGMKGPPRPDLVVFSTNTGQELLRWFEFYGARYGIQIVGHHPPAALHEMNSTELYSAEEQLLRLIEQVEGATGLTLSMDRLGEAVAYTAQAAKLWGEILDLARVAPAPLSFFDMLIHMAPMVMLRGTPEAVSYYQLLKSEVEDRIANNIAAVPGERQRFFWDGPPVWSALRPLAQIFADHGIAIVASTFCETFALSGFDPRDPVESLARSYAAVFGNRSERYQRDYLADKFSRFNIDAAVFHDCRTTPEASHVRYGLAVRTERQTGVPALVIEADSHDERLFSANRLQRRLEEFLEQHEPQTAFVGDR